MGDSYIGKLQGHSSPCGPLRCILLMISSLILSANMQGPTQFGQPENIKITTVLGVINVPKSFIILLQLVLYAFRYGIVRAITTNTNPIASYGPVCNRIF